MGIIDNGIEDFEIKDGVLVRYKGRRKNVEIPSNVTQIGDKAFQGRITPSSITIPDSVTSIGNWAFFGCTSLQSITIPDSVTSIGNYAFDGCKNLKTIFNHSALNIQKGSETHGMVAKYAENVFND